MNHGVVTGGADQLYPSLIRLVVRFLADEGRQELPRRLAAQRPRAGEKCTHPLGAVACIASRAALRAENGGV